MKELPSGWSEATLSEVADIILGQSPPGASYNHSGVGIPLFQGKAEFGKLFPSVAKWTTAPKKYAKQGDILLSVRAPVGPTNLAPSDCAIGRGLHAIRPLDKMDRFFVLWSLRASEHHLHKVSTGSTFNAITGQQVKNHNIRIAPYPEQKRIVERIEKIFARIDAVESTLISLLEKVNLLRSAILGNAFHANRSLPSGWAQKELGSVAETQLGKTLSRKAKRGIRPRGYLRNINVRWHSINLDDIAIMDFTESESQKYEIRRGDLLVCEGGEVGRCATWELPTSELHFQNALHRVRPYEGLTGKWVEYFLHWSAVTGLLRQQTSGVTLAHLTQGRIRKLQIPIPSVAEQKQIISSISALFSLLDTKENSLQWSLERVTTLRQSVLAEAFAGRLVPQDPNDEPASALLDRIAVTRPARPPRQKVKS